MPAWDGDAPSARRRGARDPLRRDRAGDGFCRRAFDVLLLPFPSSAWAGGSTCTGPRSRSGHRLALRRGRRRHDPAPRRARSGRLSARGEADRGGSRFPGGAAPTCTAAEAAADARDPHALVSARAPRQPAGAGRGGGRVLSEPATTRCWGSGPPPGARRARGGRRGPRARAAPARAPAREPRHGARRGWAGAARADRRAPPPRSTTASRSTYVPYVSAATRSRLSRAGAPGRHPRLAVALRRLRRSFAVRARARAQRGPCRRRGAPRSRRRPAGRLGARSATCSTRPGRSSAGALRGGAAASGRPGWCSPTARASPSSSAQNGARETRVVHLGAELSVGQRPRRCPPARRSGWRRAVARASTKLPLLVPATLRLEAADQSGAIWIR